MRAQGNSRDGGTLCFAVLNCTEHVTSPRWRQIGHAHGEIIAGNASR